MTRIDADWLRDETLQKLLACLSVEGDEARVVGGAVRNHLMGRAITDIDVATTSEPAETARRIEAAGFKAVPTGIEHGTVTAVREGRPFEVTTLRKDVETDGRRAKVSFGKDWRADAERRDFTVNALYARADGEVVDLVGGIRDIETGTLRFIGEAARRIEEDYLRILRFYRFFAWYGQGRPDADGIRASTRLKDGLDQLSAERVWAELRKLFAAPDPGRALLWMRQSGVLSRVLPESEKWGIDALPALSETERALGWEPDPIRRLQAIVPPDPERMAALAKRLRLSNVDRDRMTAWAMAEEPRADESDGAFRARLLFGNRAAIVDRLRLRLASTRGKAGADAASLQALAQLSTRLAEAERFDPPEFPVSGHDLQERGVKPGPSLGRHLDALKRRWAESGFTLKRDALLASVSPD
ncbi:CCA tRNA nucleotidyltransferase [Aureimonas ureilytica]|uniref:CCA tRNA nucleotidyltransferase n=1 Tax=Aureimonas ureilytica TaxID=401562 RepID=UPI000372F1BB|nr:CCA tRNA nucleotidyltransferase [Aureimonas ureilytica]